MTFLPSLRRRRAGPEPPPPAEPAPFVIIDASGAEVTGETLAAFRRDLTAALLPGVLGYVVAAVEPGGHASLTHASLLDRGEAGWEAAAWRRGPETEWGRHVICEVREVTVGDGDGA